MLVVWGSLCLLCRVLCACCVGFSVHVVWGSLCLLCSVLCACCVGFSLVVYNSHSLLFTRTLFFTLLASMHFLAITVATEWLLLKT